MRSYCTAVPSNPFCPCAGHTWIWQGQSSSNETQVACQADRPSGEMVGPLHVCSTLHLQSPLALSKSHPWCIKCIVRAHATHIRSNETHRMMQLEKWFWGFDNWTRYARPGLHGSGRARAAYCSTGSWLVRRHATAEAEALSAGALHIHSSPAAGCGCSAVFWGHVQGHAASTAWSRAPAQVQHACLACS